MQRDFAGRSAKAVAKRSVKSRSPQRAIIVMEHGKKQKYRLVSQKGKKGGTVRQQAAAHMRAEK